jgi:outer membrane protein assembly factor BamB
MKMKKTKIATLITLFLMLTATISLVGMPGANAASLKTYPVIGATPNPVQVGTQTLILVGITQQVASALYGWHGITVTVTKPDQKTEKLDNGGIGYTTDSTGMTGVTYTPTMVGNYTLQVHFPEQLNPAAIAAFGGNPIAANTTMLASDSIVITLVVQNDPIPSYPGIPLPTEFWSRPVDSQLREWSSIDGNWITTPPNFLAFGNNMAPESAHVLWTKPLTSGGQVGGTLDPFQEILTQPDQSGQSGQVGYDTGDAYEGKWSGSLILGGKLYYQKYASGDPYRETVAVDLHTGKQLWSKVLLNNLTLSRGQLVYWQTMDFYGTYDYLWATANSGTYPLLGLNSSAGTTWCAFDPDTGDYVYSMTNMPTATSTVYGKHGEILIYYLNTANGYIYMWNSTNIPQEYASYVDGSMGWSQWRPMGKILNATGKAGVLVNYGSGNVAVPNHYMTPTGYAGYNWRINNTALKGLPGSVRMTVAQDKMVGGFVSNTTVGLWAIDLRPGHEGTLLYNTNWTAPSEWATGNLAVGFGAQSFIDNTITVNAKESRYRYGFSLTDGSYKWTIDTPLAMLSHLTGGFSGEGGVIAYGMLYSGTVSGVIQAFNATNGKQVWSQTIQDPFTENTWTNNWPMGYLIVANGIVYIAQMEHSGNQPLPRGGPFVALNATTGAVIWRANGMFRQTVWGGRAIIGDSIIATMDTYDQRIYAIGKGPSAITVAAGPKTSTFGSSVVIEGHVTDVSPGTSDTVLAARFPNGVPAVSDASMSDWMLYVYKQFPRPTNATGVEVILSVLDSNNNTREIGRTTADSDGYYNFQWNPDISGKYTVYASFAGSKAYYPSHATTAFAVDEAPETPVQEPVQTPASMTDTYILGSTVAIIIAIAAGFAIVMLRKRP